MTSVIVYTRLSTEDQHGSTDRQEGACRAYAEARDWEVAEVLTDVDASAYQGTPRPAFDTLVDQAGIRSADGILVWKLDRLVRRPVDFERLWDVADRRQVFVASVTEPVDSSSPIGLAMLRILVALAGLESATTGLRIRAMRRDEAESGKPPDQQGLRLHPRLDRDRPRRGRRHPRSREPRSSPGNDSTPSPATYTAEASQPRRAVHGAEPRWDTSSETRVSSATAPTGAR